MSINGAGASAPLLSLTHITKTYPGVVALDDVTVAFEAGEVHAIIGENGAGKSTLIKTVAGAIVPDRGTIAVAGEEFSAMKPAQSRTLGIEVIYQEFNLVPTLSVTENIFLAQYSGIPINFSQMRRNAATLLEELGVSLDPDMLVRDLPSSQQQLVEIAKALAKKPRILIMDEPTAPLSMAEVESLFAIIRKARDNGTCIIYVSHRLDEIFTICSKITVLRDGQYVTTVATKDTDHDGLVKLMVGRELSKSYPVRQPASEDVALELENLSGNGNAPISFKLKRGEILGVAGLVGAGRTELAKVIYGAVRKDSGIMRVNGKDVSFSNPKDALRAGIGLVPENRKEEGVFLEKPIRWNVAIAALEWLKKGIIVDSKAENNIAEQYRNSLQIKTPSLDQLVKNLSGGNQQKVVIAKTLAAKAEIIIFDEPTRGIDVGARAEVYNLMVDLATKGIAILMITSDMEELLGMSDRILVLHESRMAGLIPGSEATQERVLSLASGLKERQSA
ncbi:sugar ABC transporter ATP-binding protein [uncultured Cohaesibacter sp.]|uniref:sugar ABC transporter ATP-binding protein n=1 Tax=uncultured Cohaesibacter sp. TaxID=1002546 RepID=UPI0029C5FF73|nr:sugar ABC transporter ATP-binding protein [uncultured Cohaesibacter sp.]